MTVAEAERSPGLGVDVAAALQVTLGKVADALERTARARPWQDVHPVPILAGGMTLTGGAGVIDQPDLLGPKDGLWWDVRRVSAWGFTAGTVGIYLNDPTGTGELLASFTQPGQYTWSSQVLLGPRDRLVVVASGVTGSVTVAGQAVEISAPILPAYLV